MADQEPQETPESKPSEPFKAWKRPVLPHERKADPAAARGGSLVTAGLEFAAIVGLMTWLGRVLDAKFGWDPWGTAGLAMFGVLCAFILLMRRIQRLQARKPQSKAHDTSKDADE